ncbi:MAG: hypothetical protein RLN90_08685 [Balneolaceae bacterium]
MVELFHDWNLWNFILGFIGLGVTIYAVKIASEQLKLMREGTYLDEDPEREQLTEERFVKDKLDNQVINSIAKTIKKEFDSYTDFIVLRFGSSVTFQDQEINDYDYMVLLLGYVEESERGELISGEPFIANYNNKNIDIQYRDFNSFLFGLTAGLPFEHSVINSHYYIYGDKSYIEWLKRISVNLVIDSEYLNDLLIERAHDVNKFLNDYFDIEQPYLMIVKMYSLMSIICQILCTKNLPKEIDSKTVLQLSKPDVLIEVIENADFKLCYSEIIQLFKKRTLEIDYSRLIDMKNIAVQFAMETFNE